jgi:hypothetical protein
LQSIGFLVATIDLSLVTDVESLVDCLKLSIKIPDYTGYNLNAIDDSLRDIPEGYAGYVLVAHKSDGFWRNDPDLALMLTSNWHYGAEYWASRSIPFHLVYVI